MDLSTFNAFKSIKMENSISVEGDTLLQCQKVITSIAEDVINVCEENGIWYELGGGTALGAIRHRGFIPWDDDIDLNVLGKDLERLRDAIQKTYGNKYTFLDYTVPDYGLAMCKVMLNGTVYRDRESINSSNCGFFVDIFPVENVPDNPLLRRIHGTMCMVAGGMLSCRKFFFNRKFMHEIAKQNPDLRSTINLKLFLGALIGWIPLAACTRLTDIIYGMCKNENSKLVTIPTGRKHYWKGLTLRENIVPVKKVEFDGHLWNVAENHDAYLKRLYGNNYMTPPPEGSVEHHVLFELKFPET